jgi:hypothetical protein
MYPKKFFATSKHGYRTHHHNTTVNKLSNKPVDLHGGNTFWLADETQCFCFNGTENGNHCVPWYVKLCYDKNQASSVQESSCPHSVALNRPFVDADMHFEQETSVKPVSSNHVPVTRKYVHKLVSIIVTAHYDIDPSHPFINSYIEHSNSERYTPSSEPFRIWYTCPTVLPVRWNP